MSTLKALSKYLSKWIPQKQWKIMYRFNHQIQFISWSPKEKKLSISYCKFICIKKAYGRCPNLKRRFVSLYDLPTLKQRYCLNNGWIILSILQTLFQPKNYLKPTSTRFFSTIIHVMLFYLQACFAIYMRLRWFRHSYCLLFHFYVAIFHLHMEYVYPCVIGYSRGKKEKTWRSSPIKWQHYGKI